jgi:hypothetical protein
MHLDREYRPYHLNAETRKTAPGELTLVTTYVWVDDELKACRLKASASPRNRSTKRPP